MPPETQPTSNQNTTDLNFNRNKDRAMHVVMLTIIAILTAALGLISWQNYQLAREVKINSFADCAAAGYPIMESYPERCMSRYGRSFTNEEQSNQSASNDQISMIVPNIESWKTHNNQSFSYNYPSNLVIVENPRNFDTSYDTQYFLLNSSVLTEYLECLETGIQQAQQHKEDPNYFPDWVDWEGSCDIERVVLRIEVDDVPSSHTTEPELIVDDKYRQWIISTHGGLGDTIVLIATILHSENYVAYSSVKKISQYRKATGSEWLQYRI